MYQYMSMRPQIRLWLIHCGERCVQFGLQCSALPTVPASGPDPPCDNQPGLKSAFGPFLGHHSPHLFLKLSQQRSRNFCFRSFCSQDKPDVTSGQGPALSSVDCYRAQWHLKIINININMQSSIVANSHSNLQNVKIDDSGCILVLQQWNREIEEKLQ